MKFFSAVLSLFICVLLISCSKDDGIWVETNLPDDTDFTLLESWTYEVPFEVKSNGDWEIETTGDWFYVFPKSGKGNKTVKIAVFENEQDERRTGSINIYSTSSSVVQTIQIGQKGVLDYNLMDGPTGKRSRKDLAIGFGYDTRMSYASSDAVKIQILRTAEMQDTGLFVINSPGGDYIEKTITGSSLKNLAENLSASLQFKWKYCGFKGEVEAGFGKGTTENEFNEYAITYIESQMRDVSVNTDLLDLRKNWLAENAKEAINGEDPYYQGEEGIKNLLDNFGTHLIIKAQLGGRLRYNLKVDVSKVTGYYDINAYVKSSYKNIFTKTEASLDAEIQESYEKNKANTSLSFSVNGGETLLLTNSSDKGAVDKWKQSLNFDFEDYEKNNVALIGFGKNLDGLIPIYELASDPARRAEIKSLMESDGFAPVDYVDKNVYRIEVPSFANDKTETLVKEVKDQNDRVVAVVCNEFIPEISPTKRVNVVYPVSSGRILMHAGFFTGYQGRRPARISWNGSSLKIVDCEELEENNFNDLYISGATVNVESSKNFKRTYNDDAYLMAKNINLSNPVDYNYPLVKIFGNIWTRESLKAQVNGVGASYGIYILTSVNSEISLSNGTSACYKNTEMMYNPKTASHTDFAPSGWEIPDSIHYAEIHNMLKKYNLNSGQLFRNASNTMPTLGYEATSGWMKALRADGTDRSYFKYQSGATENRYWAKNYNYVIINETGFKIEKATGLRKNDFLPVRLIKKN